MDKLTLLDLRHSIDTAGCFVDFALVRDSISVNRYLTDETALESIGKPNDENEARGKCPKCEKSKSFSLNTEGKSV